MAQLSMAHTTLKDETSSTVVGRLSLGLVSIGLCLVRKAMSSAMTPADFVNRRDYDPRRS